ncbi:unnamed protein product [Peniophora sp. CBMAI 1063]|nr:unnamed protein product [Peniophora sp. CBMAI 1063]
MADPDREPRASTDQETAPLLENEQPTSSKLGDLLHEPLTPLTQLLLILTLFFLIVSSIFIGLFAGAETRLKATPEGGSVTVTSTITVPTTIIATTAVPAPGPTAPPEKPASCLTADCVKLAASLLESMDTTQDPCENFYDYAAGGWLRSHPLPADKGRYGQFASLSNENLAIVRDILDAESPSALAETALVADDEKRLLNKLRDLYESCMDEDTLAKFGDLPLREVVRTVRRLFRQEGTKIYATGEEGEAGKRRKGLSAALAYLHSKGITALFDLGIDGDAAVDPNHMVLWFNQPFSFGLPSKEYFEDEDMRDLYEDVLKDLLEALEEKEEDVVDDEWVLVKRDEKKQAVLDIEETEETVKSWPPWPWPPWDGDDDGDKPHKPSPPTPAKLAANVVAFERKLANATLDLDKLTQDPFGTYNKIPLSNISSTLNQLDFGGYLASFNPRNFPEFAIVTYPPFISSLSQLLDDVDKDTLEAYLTTRPMLALASRLSTETAAWKAKRRLTETLQGIKPGALPDRAEYCVEAVDSALGFGAGHFFVSETFSPDARARGEHIISSIIESFKTSLKSVEWMDKESAKKAGEKADKLRIKVGYPTSPDTLSARALLNYYSLVKVDERTYFDNMLSADASEVYKMWQTLGKARDLAAWEMTPATVNAYYNPPANELVFPAGIMRPPFFHLSWPSYLQYGAFGMVASHELTHAFDSSGRMYNQDGKLEEWWSNSTSEAFNGKQKCIEQQYGNYTVIGPDGKVEHVNGLLTAGENIGDSGIIQSLRAWRAEFNASLEAGNEYTLPGLDHLTREQLFFVASGRQWAESIKPASLVQRVRTDPHSPNRFRVEGTLRNVKEFAEAWGCPVGSKMNPPDEERCLLWS